MIELIPCVLEPAEQLALIEAFYDCYYNTDQHVELFGPEFFFVVGYIMKGEAPYRLNYLSEFLEIICKASPGYEKALAAHLGYPSPKTTSDFVDILGKGGDTE